MHYAPDWHRPAATPAEAHALHTEVRLKRSPRELVHGTAADAYTTGDCGETLVDLCNTSLLIPLNKNVHSSDVRPLAIPGLWRKLASRNTVAAFRQPLQHGGGPHQHSAMLPNGSTLTALKAQALVAQAGSTLAVIRTDTANAFNDVSRASALAALHHIDHQLASCRHSWLMRPTIAVTRGPAGHRELLRTSRGIPQKPMSSLTFTAIFAQPLADMAASEDTPVTPLAFADDTLLITPRYSVTTVVSRWEAALRPHLLSLSLHKIFIWSPQCDTPPAEIVTAFPSATFSADGIIICGLPCASSSSADDPDALLPWGTRDFALTRLETLKTSLLRRFSTLSQLEELLGPASPDCHLPCMSDGSTCRLDSSTFGDICRGLCFTSGLGRSTNTGPIGLVSCCPCPWTTPLLLAKPPYTTFPEP